MNNRDIHAALGFAVLWLAVGVGGFVFASSDRWNDRKPAALVLRADGPVGTWPDLMITPGATDPAVTQATIMRTICRPGYTKTVRDVPEAAKKAVVEAYLRAHPDWPKCKPVGDVACEVDHLVSLELGGSNDASNLWPQPYCPLPRNPACLGAREKDVIETFLHRHICDGDIALKDAQEHIVRDWVYEYQELMKP